MPPPLASAEGCLNHSVTHQADRKRRWHRVPLWAVQPRNPGASALERCNQPPRGQTLFVPAHAGKQDPPRDPQARRHRPPSRPHPQEQPMRRWHCAHCVNAGSYRWSRRGPLQRSLQPPIRQGTYKSYRHSDHFQRGERACIPPPRGADDRRSAPSELDRPTLGDAQYENRPQTAWLQERLRPPEASGSYLGLNALEPTPRDD